MKFFKLLSLSFLVLLLGFGCANDRTISESPFESIKFSDKWITITAQPDYNIENSYKKEVLPKKAETVNLVALKELFGEPGNSFTDKNEVKYEFYLENGKYVLTNYDIQEENAVYKKAGYALEYFPTNLKFTEFFNVQVSCYIKEHQKNNDEVVVILFPNGKGGAKDIDLLAVIRGGNIESIVF